MKICTILDNEVLADTLRDPDMIDAMTPSIPKHAVIIDSDLPATGENEALVMFGERDNSGHYLSSKNVKIVPDFRGKTAYQRTDGQPIDIKDLGELPDSLTFEERPSQYHTFYDAKWVITDTNKALMLSDQRKKYQKMIDGVIGQIYTEHQKYQKEYELREFEALAFKESGYTGAVPEQVKSFADAAGFDGKQAADIILGQASLFNVALSKLGALRMRKFELNAINDIDGMERLFNDIKQQTETIAATL